MIAENVEPTPSLSPEELNLPGEDDLITDDGVPMESNRHREQMNLLIDALKYHWRDRTDYFIGGNMFIYFSAEQVKRNDFRGPDFFVVLDTTWRDRKAWVVWDEDGKAPDVIVELLSESTATVDRTDKKDIYEKNLKVSEYFLFDPYTAECEAYRLVAGSYVPIEPGADGRWTSNRLGLKLGTWEGEYGLVQMAWLRWFTQDGAMLPTWTEAESARADIESKRASELARKLEEYKKRFGEL